MVTYPDPRHWEFWQVTNVISAPEFAGGEEAAARAERDKSEATSGWGAPIAVLRAPGCSVSSFPQVATTTAVRSSPSSSASSFIDQMLSLARTVALSAHAVCFVRDIP